MNDQETIAAAEAAFQAVGFPHATASVGDDRMLKVTPAPGVDYHVSAGVPLQFPAEELRSMADAARCDLDVAVKTVFE